MVDKKLTDEELDDYIHDLLILAEVRRFDEMPDVEPKLSPEYQKKFTEMLSDPLGYVKKKNRRRWVPICKYALAAALLLFIVANIIFAGTDSRIMANNLWTRIFGGYTTFSFINKAEEITLPDVEFEYVPEGFELIFEDERINLYRLARYASGDNNWFEFLMTTKKERYLSIDSEYHDRKFVKLDNGIEAQFLKSTSEDWPNYVLWSSTDGKITFSVYGIISKEELFEIANAIKVK